jgi:hypothetical protein
MCSMTEQGSARARFRRALRSGDALLVVTTAHAVGRLSVPEAFAVVLVLAAGRDPRGRRAARRLADRAAAEQAAVRALHDALATELERAVEGDREAADRAAILLEGAGFRGAMRELRERREADGSGAPDAAT